MKFIGVNKKLINVNNIIKIEFDENLKKYAISIIGESPILITKSQYERLETLVLAPYIVEI